MTSVLAVLALDFVTDIVHVPGNFMNCTVLDLWVGFFVALASLPLCSWPSRWGNLSRPHLSEAYVLQAKFDNIGGSRCAAR